jgi:C-terminal binding protein
VRAKPFGLDVVFYDPNLEDGIEKSVGVRRANTLQELMQASDIISLNCDLNNSNRQFINRYVVKLS